MFIGFVGYSLMITVFTPMLLRSDRAMLPPAARSPTARVVLGGCSPLSARPVPRLAGPGVALRPLRPPADPAAVARRHHRLLRLISFASRRNSLALLAAASLLAGLAEANIVTAQSAIADVVAPGSATAISAMSTWR